MYEIIMALVIKFKTVILSGLAAYVASTMRYFKQKREGKLPTISGWFMFGITAWLVTYSTFQILSYCCPTIEDGLRITIAFWCGYMSDFFYAWIPAMIKKYVNKKSENI